jgi:hypothetical protein
VKANGKVFVSASQLVVSVSSPKCEYGVTKLKVRFGVAGPGNGNAGRTEGNVSGKARLISGEPSCPRKTAAFGTLVVRAEATHEPFWAREQ